MMCPKCGSRDTYKPSVMSLRWKLGTQVCKRCDYQDDWLKFTGTDLCAVKIKIGEEDERFKK